MSLVVQSRFESEVTNANEDIFTRSYIESNATIIEFDVRKRDYTGSFGVKDINWSNETYVVDVWELATLFNPIKYRFIVARGYFNKDGKQAFFTPKIEGVSTSQHMSKSIIRLSAYLAVICGVSLRNIATIFAFLFLVPITKSTIKRWIDEIGDNLPSEEDILKMLIKLKKPEECNIDGYYPLGTNNCVMVIRDEYGRILITHECESENSEDATKFLKKLKDAGIKIEFAFSDYSDSFIGPLKEVFPKVKFQADHFHTVKNIWKHLKKALLEYRRNIKSKGKEEKDDELIELASKLWKLRWVLLKKPSNLTQEEQESINELNKKDTGFIKKFRAIIRQLVNIFDRSNTEIQAEVKLKNLKRQVDDLENKFLDKIVKFFNDHWDQAMHYIKKKGPAKYKRFSNSEPGMRILRKLEKSHDGIRSKKTRKDYIKIFQSVKYLSMDMADFISNKPFQTISRE